MNNKHLDKKAQDVANNSTVIEETINELVEEIERLENELSDAVDSIESLIQKNAKLERELEEKSK